MNLTGYGIAKVGDIECIKLTGTTGIASFEFPFPSGEYDLDARYLSEKAGQNTYALYIGNNQVIAWVGKDRDDKWYTVSEQKWHAPRRIPLVKGDKIQIKSLSDQGSLAILDYIEFTPTTRSVSTTEGDLITIYPKEYDHGFRNPLKGFRSKLRSDATVTDVADTEKTTKEAHEYGTLSKMYFTWKELESKASDGVEKIKEVCDSKWRGIEAMNHKIIPRVYLLWPKKESGWPSDMVHGDITSDQFNQRVITFIEKLGKAWDNDSRVAYVEVGLIGEWGEMEWPDTTDELKGVIAAQFSAAFKNKLIMIRWPNTYNDHIYNFGYYWDSFAHLDQDYYSYILAKTGTRWKTAVIGGESAYNWGNFAIQPGKSPNESLTKTVHRDYIIDRIRKLHTNHVGWISNYNQSDANVQAGAEVVQKALGYRFVLSEVTYPRKIEAGKSFTLSFKVKNTGSTPFYYNWPLEVSLLDPTTRKVIWNRKCNEVDIRKWMPGDQWDDETDLYKIPADDNLINQTLEVSGAPAGEYILALAILDPAGDQPCARFAIKNYFKGGRHPIGKIGVGRTIASFELTGFDDLKTDASLFYQKTVK